MTPHTPQSRVQRVEKLRALGDLLGRWAKYERAVRAHFQEKERDDAWQKRWSELYKTAVDDSAAIEAAVEIAETLAKMCFEHNDCLDDDELSRVCRRAADEAAARLVES